MLSGTAPHFIPRFFEDTPQSFFLFGPRGTGKSTLIQTLYPDALYIDLLKPDVLRNYLAYPERLREVIAGQNNINTVVIDEVQKAPQILSVVHSLIEDKRDIKFILTGSSARKIKQMDANLLGGRAIKRVLHPFMASEIGEIFNLDKAIQHGLLPLSVTSINPEETIRGYTSLYIHEEIQSEGLIRRLDDFARFLEAVSFSHGAILNISNIARECSVNRKTAENYINILEDLLLSFQIPIFSKKAKRQLSSHPKFYLFDSGVYQELRPKGPLDYTSEIEGVALEGIIAHHLKAWVDYTPQKHDLGFWRTRSGLEVDFVVYGPLGFWAVEVKNSQKVRLQDTKPLEEFLEDYPEAIGILLYRGNETFKRKNILCLPVENFLKQLIPKKTLY